ncbi:MAG: hypothetical protein ACXVAY_13185 [Mucilaginibacter sp.]
MKKSLLIISLSLAFIFNHANAQLVLGMRGEPVVTTEYSEVQGNPYLIDDWVSGFVILDNQKAMANLKFDIVSNTVLYQGKGGETLALKNKFDTFTLTPVISDVSTLKPFVFIDGLPAINKQTSYTFYQLIADGKVKLVKYYKKIIDERPGTGYTAATTRSFKLIQVYYILKDNQMVEVQPSKKSITKLFDDHATQLDAYLKANSINFRSDADLQKLFTWYNSL